MIRFEFTIKELKEIHNIAEASLLKLQVEGTGIVTVEGSLDGVEYTPLTGISESFKTVSAITNKGLYSYDISGLNFIQVKKATKELSVKVVGVE